MADYLQDLVATWHWTALLGVMIVAILALGKGADWLIDEAVTLSLRSGMPRVIVGATVVSVGTTTPEAMVSVLAAFQGEPGLALGNAVGSIICDTGLILGLACLWRPLPIDRQLVNRQGWVQFGCGVLLVACCVRWSQPLTSFTLGGTLSQLAGLALLGLLAVYMVWSVRLARLVKGQEEHLETDAKHNAVVSLLRLLVALAIVLVACSFSIATARELAERLHVPPGIIAATIVAFGTSLPELIIVLTATAKGHGELAVGNVIGADILNVLFVAGAAAAATPRGLAADPHFFQMQFPAMLFVLLIFRIGIWRARDDKLTRPIGAVLLLAYLAVTGLSFALTGTAGH